MILPFVRCLFAPDLPQSRTRISGQETLVFDSGRSSATFYPSSSLAAEEATTTATTATTTKYTVSNRLPPAPQPFSITNLAESLYGATTNSTLCPPLHWHRYQTETFRVISGTARFFFVDSVSSWFTFFLFKTDLKVIEAGEGEVVVVDQKRWHTFRNASFRDELVLEFGLDPDSDSDSDSDSSQDLLLGGEQFFRNSWMDREDCGRNNIKRSFVQVCLVNYYGGVVGVSWPGLGVYMGSMLGVLANFWVGKVWGEMILGLKGSYEEYYLGPTEMNKKFKKDL